MKTDPQTQPERALSLLAQNGMMRGVELSKAGITAAAISRLERKGAVVRLDRGLYQLPQVDFDVNHDLAEIAKRVPNAVICLSSALAFYGLTDTIPSKVWIAIGSKAWEPRGRNLQVVRFGPRFLTTGIEFHDVEGVKVRVYGPAKTIVDLFRYRETEGTRFSKSPGLNLAIEGLRAGLRTRKATPAAIAKFAMQAGIWNVIEPFLLAMTANV